VKVLLYGRLTDSIGRQVQLEAPEGCSVAGLRRLLSETHPEAAEQLTRSRAVVGGAIAGDDHLVRADEDVEFLPPVSGG
jgi:molybdopterin converting factor small subunit